MGQIFLKCFPLTRKRDSVNEDLNLKKILKFLEITRKTVVCVL